MLMKALYNTCRSMGTLYMKVMYNKFMDANIMDATKMVIIKLAYYRAVSIRRYLLWKNRNKIKMIRTYLSSLLYHPSEFRSDCIDCYGFNPNNPYTIEVNIYNNMATVFQGNVVEMAFSWASITETYLHYYNHRV